MRPGRRVLLALAILTALNASYLAAFDSATIFYYANVIAHVVLGALLTIALGWSLVRWWLDRTAERGSERAAEAPGQRRGALSDAPHPARGFPLGAQKGGVLKRAGQTEAWAEQEALGDRMRGEPARSRDHPRRRGSGRSVAGAVHAASALGMVATGAVLARTGTATAMRPLLHAHEAAALLFVALGVVLVWAAEGGSRRARLLALAAAAAAIFPAFVRIADLARPAHVATITNPALPPESPYEEGGGRNSPFFPSSNRTVSGGLIRSDFFLESKSCGNAGCHPDITAQWESSAHHFSSFNNQWYRKSIEYMQDMVGTTPSKWCGGCHDMAILLTGRMDTPIREQIQTPEAQAGIGCLVCHSIVHVSDTMGQGGFTIEYPEMHRLVASPSPVLRFLHDRMVLLDPAPHKATMLKPFHRHSTPEFCSSCHKVHLDLPVNRFRWFRGFNDYDSWQQSGVSMQGARAFYYPDGPKKCGSCHMPLVRSNDRGNIKGMVHSHRFPGANTALPFVNQDRVQFETVKAFLQDAILTLDIFGVSEEPAGEIDAVHGREPDEDAPAGGPSMARGSTGAVPAVQFAPAIQSMIPDEGGLVAGPSRAGAASAPRALIAPIDRAIAAARPGTTVRVDVVARTRKIGHVFPGGTLDAFDVWLELKAEDAAGRILYWNGWVADDGKGPVDPGAHFYRALLLDDHGNRINKRNAWAARAPAYARVIPPGAADTAHFRLVLPKDVMGPLKLTARMNYRKFAWWNTQWAFAGVRDPLHTDFARSERYDDGRWVFTGDTSGVSGSLKAIPDLPTIVVAEKTAVLPIGEHPAAPASSASDRERWNDYGIGLLLQKDYRGAASAFETVTRLEPGYSDGWVNRARVAVEEGDHAKALELADAALRIEPGLPKAHYFRGLALKTFGRYREAADDFTKALAVFPRDRVVLNALGRVRFLDREFGRAVETFTRTLAVDPEDITAHYNLMLAYRGLRDEASSKRHERMYERFKVDESAQFVTGAFRLLNPDENRERQPIHAHDSTWTPERLYAASGDRYREAPREPARRASLSRGGTESATDLPRTADDDRVASNRGRRKTATMMRRASPIPDARGTSFGAAAGAGTGRDPAAPGVPAREDGAGTAVKADAGAGPER